MQLVEALIQSLGPQQLCLTPLAPLQRVYTIITGYCDGCAGTLQKCYVLPDWALRIAFWLSIF